MDIVGLMLIVLVVCGIMKIMAMIKEHEEKKKK